MDKIENEINEIINNFSKPKLLWIRVDDVGIYSNNFSKLVNLFVKYDLPVVYAVIPSKLEQQTICLISKLKNFVISQHGYSHKNYSLEYQCELADNRDIKKVLTEMKKGKKLLQQTFGNKFYSLLTPPFNKIDIKCAKFLEKEYDCISIFANSSTSFKKDFNPNVDIINWHINAFEDKNFILQQIKKSLINFDHLGVCIHSEYLTENSFIILDEIFSFLTNNTKIKTDYEILKKYLIV